MLSFSVYNMDIKSLLFSNCFKLLRVTVALQWLISGTLRMRQKYTSEKMPPRT